MKKFFSADCLLFVLLLVLKVVLELTGGGDGEWLTELVVAVHLGLSMLWRRTGALGGRRRRALFAFLITLLLCDVRCGLRLGLELQERPRLPLGSCSAPPTASYTENYDRRSFKAFWPRVVSAVCVLQLAVQQQTMFVLMK